MFHVAEKFICNCVCNPLNVVFAYIKSSNSFNFDLFVVVCAYCSLHSIDTQYMYIFIDVMKRPIFQFQPKYFSTSATQQLLHNATTSSIVLPLQTNVHDTDKFLATVSASSPDDKPISLSVHAKGRILSLDALFQEISSAVVDDESNPISIEFKNNGVTGDLKYTKKMSSITDKVYALILRAEDSRSECILQAKSYQPGPCFATVVILFPTVVYSCPGNLHYTLPESQNTMPFSWLTSYPFHTSAPALLWFEFQTTTQSTLSAISNNIYTVGAFSHRLISHPSVFKCDFQVQFPYIADLMSYECY